MSSQPRGHGRTHSLYKIYTLFVVIFFFMLIFLVTLNAILLYQLAKDDTQLQLYLDHYSRNWLSAAIQLLTMATLSCALCVVCFSIYMLKLCTTPRLSERRSLRRSLSDRNRYFNETISTRTVTRTRPDNTSRSSSCQPHKSFARRQQALVENIHIEKSITFH